MADDVWQEKRYDAQYQRDVLTTFDSEYLNKCLTSGRGSVLAGIPKTKAFKVWTDPVTLDIVLRYIPAGQEPDEQPS